MRIHLIAVGKRLPDWMNAGFDAYAKRLPRDWLRLTEVATARRGAGPGTAERARRHEGERMLAAIPPAARPIALDESGRTLDTRAISQRMSGWMHAGDDVALLIGGPDGLAPACLAIAAEVWSLSRLTFPHGLARIIIAEQLYRAWSLLQHHPYHRD
jgi:23S rRNA (pseudouridine1915-N3)-methyltransferase